MKKGARVVLVFLLLLMLSVQQHYFLSASEITDKSSYPSKGLIVKLKEGSSVKSLGMVSSKSAHNFHLVSVAKGKEQEEIRKLSLRPEVAYVEPNYVRQLIRPQHGGPTVTVTTTVTPNFEYLKWISADLAHDKGYKGDGSVIIAIADSGVYRHPLLEGSLLDGFNFLEIGSVNTDDFIGHGTQVAGIAHNLCPNCKILPLKVFDFFEGDDFNISLGIRAAGDYGARVLNLSLGGPAPSRTICEAVSYAQIKGTIIVVSAGNDSSTEVGYPAACNKEIVVVSAIDQYDNPAIFSNFGSKVDIAAPGVRILSSIPPEKWNDYSLYISMSGTSMAAPMVVGTLALIASHTSHWTSEQIARRVLDTAEDISTAPGVNDMFGKRLNVALAVGLNSRPLAIGFESKAALLPAVGGEVSFSVIARNQTSIVLLVGRGITESVNIVNLTDLVVMNPCTTRYCAQYTVPQNKSGGREIYGVSVYVQNRVGTKQTETLWLTVQSPNETQIIPKVLSFRLFLPTVRQN